MGFELKREITLERADKPIKLGIMVREPKGKAGVGSSKLKAGVNVVERAL
jgi:hypothetical protein